VKNALEQPPPLAKKFTIDKEDVPLIYIYFYDLKLFKKYDGTYYDGNRKFDSELLMLWAEKERLRSKV